jgi:hypothetical protein
MDFAHPIKMFVPGDSLKKSHRNVQLGHFLTPVIIPFYQAPVYPYRNTQEI